MTKLLVAIVILGTKPWCSVFPNRSCYFCLPQSNEQSIYCVWNTKEECEMNRQESDEYCQSKVLTNPKSEEVSSFLE